MAAETPGPSPHDKTSTLAFVRAFILAITLCRQVLLDAVDRRKKVKEIEERIHEIEHDHELGRITEEKYRELKSKYEEELKKYM